MYTRTIQICMQMAQQKLSYIATLVRTLIPFNVAAIIRGNSQCSQQAELGNRANSANLTVGARDKNDHCETLPCSLQLFS